MCATYQEHSGFTGIAGGILKYNSGTEDWELKQSTGANAATSNICVVNGVWYCGVYAGASKGLWRSTDDGETWVKDTSWTYTNWAGYGPSQLAVDSGNNFCCINMWLASGNWRAYERYGQYGAGPFTPTAIIPPDDWGYNVPNPEIQGRLMVADEQDDLWLAIDRNSFTHLVRRDSTSGLWSIEHVFSSGAQAMTVSVADSQNIWGANQFYVALYDGVTWYEHNYPSLQAQRQVTPAVWGQLYMIDYTRRSDETVTAVDTVTQFDVSHRIKNETVTAVDALSTLPGKAYRSDETVATEDQLWAERITFLRTQHEDLTAVDAVDRLALLVGSTGTADKPAPGWEVREFKKTLRKDLTPGEIWTFTVEDHFDYRTLCDGVLWIQNTEAQNVYAQVVERVEFDGRLDDFVLFEGTLLGKSIEPVRLSQPVTLPSRVVYHVVTLTNNEVGEDAYVITLIGGWVGHATYLPAELPHVYGEGLQ
jgi:gamma-glutamylcyclotransferase (GGCT)/AIG2-like uncharacterized protein YtfP